MNAGLSSLCPYFHSFFNVLHTAFVSVDVWLWKEEIQNTVHVQINNDRALQCPDPTKMTEDNESDRIGITSPIAALLLYTHKSYEQP